LREVNKLSSATDFALIYGTDGKDLPNRFPSGRPVKANVQNKAGAVKFMGRVNEELIGSCIRDCLLLAIKKAKQSPLKRKTVIYMGGGEGYCGGSDKTEWQYLKATLRQVAAHNAGKVRIHTIEIPGATNIARKTFLKCYPAI